MGKTQLSIEYPLRTTSAGILWNSISTPLGLAEWFADHVRVHDEEYTFTWDIHDQTAVLLCIKPLSHIRFRWKEDEDTEHFFELRIVYPELTGGDLALLVTDFAESSEMDDLKLLWSQQVDKLRRKTGM